MQAALITGKELIEFVDFDDPSPEPEQIVVDITYCGFAEPIFIRSKAMEPHGLLHAVMNGPVLYQRLGVL